jgi:hypothetical protein
MKNQIIQHPNTNPTYLSRTFFGKILLKPQRTRKWALRACVYGFGSRPLSRKLRRLASYPTVRTMAFLFLFFKQANFTANELPLYHKPCQCVDSVSVLLSVLRVMGNNFCFDFIFTHVCFLFICIHCSSIHICFCSVCFLFIYIRRLRRPETEPYVLP